MFDNKIKKKQIQILTSVSEIFTGKGVENIAGVGLKNSSS